MKAEFAFFFIHNVRYQLFLVLFDLSFQQILLAMKSKATFSSESLEA